MNRNIHPVLAMGIILLVAAIWVAVWFHFTRPEPPAVGPQAAPVPVRAGDPASAQGGEAPTAVPDAGDAGAAAE